jgi:hypothetical protein
MMILIKRIQLLSNSFESQLFEVILRWIIKKIKNF